MNTSDFSTSVAPRTTRQTRFVSIAPRIGMICLWACFTVGGCSGGSWQGKKPELVWGRRGLSEGRLNKPRAMTIDAEDRLYVVDMSARIQVFSRDGEFLRGWRTPISEQGKPCGLTIDREGNLLVADTHYYRMLVYSRQGEWLQDRTIGGQSGSAAGQLNLVTDVVQDSEGHYYIAEYGNYDRVQKFTRNGEYVMQWGSHGKDPGQFVQPRSLEIDEQDQIWVADACNHRIQVFDASGESARLVHMWGEEGTELGQLRYPYGLALDGKGHLYVAEFGNSRVQKFTVDGHYCDHWGSAGRREGELNSPWELALDSRGRLHVLDTYNHRVQRIRL